MSDADNYDELRRGGKLAAELGDAWKHTCTHGEVTLADLARAQDLRDEVARLRAALRELHERLGDVVDSVGEIEIYSIKWLVQALRSDIEKALDEDGDA